jgi:hypothetical protein
LLLLIPFHIFVFESRLEDIESDEDALSQLKSYYSSIRIELDELVTENRISEFEKQTIIEMSNSVVDSLARKYEHVRKGVGNVMGGIILDTQAKRILNQGREEGRAEGLEEGIDIGEDRMGALYIYLEDLCRLDEYKAAVHDLSLRSKLFAEMDMANKS